MFDMYQGFAFYKNWDFEVLNYTPAEYGTSVFQSNGVKINTFIIYTDWLVLVNINNSKSWNLINQNF